MHSGAKLLAEVRLQRADAKDTPRTTDAALSVPGSVPAPGKRRKKRREELGTEDWIGPRLRPPQLFVGTCEPSRSSHLLVAVQNPIMTISVGPGPDQS